MDARRPVSLLAVALVLAGAAAWAGEIRDWEGDVLDAQPGQRFGPAGRAHESMRILDRVWRIE